MYGPLIMVMQMRRKRTVIAPPNDLAGCSLHEPSPHGEDGPERWNAADADRLWNVALHYRPWGYGQAIPLPGRRREE